MANKRKQIKSRIIAGAAAACLGISTQPGILARAEESDGVAMGRYLESEVTLPEGLHLVDAAGLSDGRLRIIGGDADEGKSIWDSSDGGETWEQAAVLPEEYSANYFLNMAVREDGAGAGIYMKMPSEPDTSPEESAKQASAEAADGGEEASAVSEEDPMDYEYYYLSFDTDGNVLENIQIQPSFVAYMEFASNGSLISMDYGGAIDVRDWETGEITGTLVSGDADMVGVCKKEILAVMAAEVQRYDIETGEPISRDETLEKAMFADGASYMITSSEGLPIAFASDEERIYYMNDKGIYAHVMGGNVVEQIVDGSLNSLSDPSIARGKLVLLDQAFYVIYTDMQGKKGMLKYEYSDEVSSIPQQELTIYSLKENTNIRQMAVLFQKQFPDAYINYEYGMSSEDGVTASDALRTLNTDILAGNGPDILVLDDMSVRTYADKGMLADLSGILDEVDEADGLYEKIAYAYRDGDTVTAVPALFCIPIAAGASEYMDRVSDFDKLSELAKEDGVFRPISITSLPEILYPVCAAAWKNEDNTVDREKLAEYVSGIRRIYDNYAENASQETLEELKDCAEGASSIFSYGAPYYYDSDIIYGYMDILEGGSKLLMGSLTTMDGYSQLTSVNRFNGNCRIQLLNGMQSDVFRPYCTLGVLNTSENAELACDFVKFALGKEAQQQQYVNGFPVNRAAFDGMLASKEYGSATGASVSSYNNMTGEGVSLDMYWPTEEEAGALKEMVEQLTVCADDESIQKNVIVEETRRCMAGETGVEEAVNTIMQKINLYLAE